MSSNVIHGTEEVFTQDAKHCKTILLVEDEPIIAIAEKKTLERNGYAVITAGSGEKAVERVRSDGAIDLVLMDIDLGRGITGTEAAEMILGERELPVVFLSSHTERAVVEKTEGITSYGYIVKNSGETVLLASIRMAFRLFQEKRSVKEHAGLLQGVLDSIQDGISVLNPDLSVRKVNRTMERWYPENGALVGRMCYTVYQRRGEPCVRCPSLRALRSGRVEREEVPGRGDSPVEWLELFSYPLKDGASGEITGVVEFVRDITDRRQLEDALRDRNALQQLLMTIATELVNIPLDEIDIGINGVLEEVGRYSGFDRVYLFRTDTTHSITRCTHEWCAPGVSSAIALLQNVPLEAMSAAASTLQDGKMYCVPAVEDLPGDDAFRCMLEAQGVRSVLLLPLMLQGAYAGFVGFDAVREKKAFSRPIVDLLQVMAEMIANIQSRQTMERELRRERRRLAGIIEGTNVGTWEWNVQTGETVFNERWAEIIGYSLAEISPVSIGTWERFAHPDDLEKSGKLLEKHFRGESRFYEIECRMKHKSGEWVWILDRGRVVSRTAEGKPLLVMGTHQDITARKRAAEALRESEAQHRMLFQSITDAIIVVDKNRRITACNPAFTSLFGYSFVEVRGRTTEFLLEKAEDFRVLGEAIRNHSDGSSFFCEVRYRRNDGSVFTGEKRVHYLRDENETITGFIGTVRNITERKATEAKIRGLVEEKETLLKEIQHRIKNSMNTMVSSISLQIAHLQNPEVTAALNDARGRFKSMEVLYDQLYRTGSHDRGSIREYLTPLIRQGVNLFPTGERVNVTIDIEDCSLAAKQLSTIGLIVNELITNAMKYAFPGNPDPQLAITGTLAAQRLTIVVTDNGPGPPPRSFATGSLTGFGITMVNALAEQLSGMIRFERNSGLHVVLECPVDLL